jgi:RNA polymerase sigma factor (sigma-70 family)
VPDIPRPATTHTDPSLPSIPSLVAASLDGDRAAWQQLVHRLERVVWKAVNMMTADDAVRQDAFAATWLRLVERLDTIREPEKLPGWLTTTATNEVRQILRHRSRQHVHVDWSAPSGVFSSLLASASGGPGADGDHERELVRAETRRSVRRAFDALDEECRQLLAVLVLTDPPISYKEASEVLGRPIGSLGPSRNRCLQKLRARLAADASA